MRSACSISRAGASPANAQEAARLFERAAQNGSSVGEVEYAILLFNGDGVPASEIPGRALFPPRRRQGQRHRPEPPRTPSRRRPRRAANKVDAAAWHILAAAQGLADPWLDDAFKDLTADERTRAEKLAAERLGMR